MKREATILIVDDEAEMREVLVEYLAAQGYATLAAENAAVARASAAARGIDLALVDVHMPGKTACRWRGTCASATPASPS